MSQTIRHQIFVSSTFTDLIVERAEVIQALWEMDCIPTGMEAFVAANESQWQVIRRVIDDSDYYVLIIGARYGSATEEGISYTEREYNYAQELGIPILAFVHADPENLPVSKAEIEPQAREKLEDFRSRVMTRYPVRKWSSAAELGGLVSRSVTREIKINPRAGWIRNDGASPISLLERIASLTEDNEKLKISQASEIEDSFDTLAQGSDSILIHGERELTVGGRYSTKYDQRWSAHVTWDDLFRDLGPALLTEATERSLKEIVARFNGWDSIPEDNEFYSSSLSTEIWNEILIQFRALGFIVPGTKKRQIADKASYWKITPRGDKHLVSLLARRRKS